MNDLDRDNFVNVDNPTLKEQIYVHEVYNEIACHFSHTRYKPWPIVDKFLKDLPDGSVGLDVGCGNGKYLSINKNVFIIGSDFSTNLVQLAYDKNVKQISLDLEKTPMNGRDKKLDESSMIDSFQSSHCDVMVADGLHLPHPNNTFDFIISIAVIHHFLNHERRIEIVKKLLQKLKKNNGKSRALIYVWALEQKNSRRGYDEGMPQDVLVPWVLQKSKKQMGQAKKQELGETKGEEKQVEDQEEKKENTKYRYYHLYKKGELEDDVLRAGGKVIDSGYERDNWWAIIA